MSKFFMAILLALTSLKAFAYPSMYAPGPNPVEKQREALRRFDEEQALREQRRLRRLQELELIDDYYRYR